jgi:hypothetical protein
MNCAIEDRNSAGRNGRRVLIVAAALAAAVFACAQASGQASPEVQEKLAAVKQSAAENQQKLHSYQWVETTQLTLKGNAKPGTQSMCKYGPDGTVQKTPMGAPPQQAAPSGGRLKQKVIANKKEEMQDYMGGVKKVIGMYVPPDPQKMQQAFQAGKVTLNPSAGAIVFKDYAQPGDQMTISFDTATKKISSLNVKTYMDNPKDAVTLTAQFASLPDGTNYVQQSVLNATAKQLVVTTVNENYQPVTGQ